MPACARSTTTASADPSAVTRDYTLRVDDEAGSAPVLSVFGGKITTYRRLAEHAMEKLAPYFPGMKRAVDRAYAASGQRLRDDREQAQSEFFQPLSAARRPRSCSRSSAATARVRRRFSATASSARTTAPGSPSASCAISCEHEWAQTAEDVLWRRTKAGLAMSEAQRERVAAGDRRDEAAGRSLDAGAVRAAARSTSTTRSPPRAS